MTRFSPSRSVENGGFLLKVFRCYGVSARLHSRRPSRVRARDAGKSVEHSNIEALVRQTTMMFVLKVQGYIAQTDPRGAERFIADHAWTGDLTLPQRVLDDTANWKSGVVPYLQDLPWRVRGLLLERSEDGTLSADIRRHMT